MEITTLIKWNGLVYGLYYGINLAYDYFKKRNRHAQEAIQYTYKDLLEETPVKVESSAQPASQQANATAIATEIKSQAGQAKVVSPVTLEGPVEDQGIPYEEIIQNSKLYSSGINF